MIELFFLCCLVGTNASARRGASILRAEAPLTPSAAGRMRSADDSNFASSVMSRYGRERGGSLGRTFVTAVQ
jgi:hypothetical protein